MPAQGGDIYRPLRRWRHSENHDHKLSITPTGPTAKPHFLFAWFEAAVLTNTQVEQARLRTLRWSCALTAALECNHSAPAGGDDGLFLPSTIEALWIRRCAYCFTLTLSQRCLLVRRINWLAISSSVLRSI